jgi:GNAT superfamily N-acetyltransferase
MKWARRLKELAEDWAFFLHRDGWKLGISTVVRQIAQLPYRHISYVVVGRSLLDPFPDFTPKIALEIRSFGLQDLNLVRIIDRPSESRACAQRLARGHTGLLALYQGQPVGYCWGCTDVVPTLERVQLNLAEGDFLCVDDYTNPAFRRKGIHTAMKLARYRLFREKGFRREVGYIESRNVASLASFRKVGSQVIGHIEYYRIGPWRWSKYTPCS